MGIFTENLSLPGRLSVRDSPGILAPYASIFTLRYFFSFSRAERQVTGNNPYSFTPRLVLEYTLPSLPPPLPPYSPSLPWGRVSGGPIGVENNFSLTEGGISSHHRHTEGSAPFTVAILIRQPKGLSASLWHERKRKRKISTIVCGMDGGGKQNRMRISERNMLSRLEKKKCNVMGRLTSRTCKKKTQPSSYFAVHLWVCFCFSNHSHRLAGKHYKPQIVQLFELCVFLPVSHRGSALSYSSFFFFVGRSDRTIGFIVPFSSINVFSCIS